MSKLNELVRLEDLAKEYQKIISNRFNLKLNANLEIDGTRENGIMLVTRQPYKISNIKAESLQIVLRFYTCCSKLKDYQDTIQILSQLCGLNKGTFISNDKEYRYYSFLDFTRPLGEPIVDTGKFYQTLEIMGTCLVTQADGGVLIGNEVETKIRLDIGKPSEFEETIEVLSANTTLTKTQEAPQMANSVTAKVFNNTQVYTYTYSILMLKNKVCERLLAGIKGIEPFGLNEEIRISEIYPEFTNEKRNLIQDLKVLVNCTISNGTVTQILADNWRRLEVFKINFFRLGENGSYIYISTNEWNDKLGINEYEFTVPNEHIDLITFGSNGHERDTMIELDCNLLMGKTYIMHYNVLSLEQGSVSWNDVAIYQKDNKIEDTKSLVLTGANLDRNAGAFVVAELTFQDRLDEENIYNYDELQESSFDDTNIDVGEGVVPYPVIGGGGNNNPPSVNF